MKKKESININSEKSKLFPIVGIGASAGGLEAIEEFLKQMPDQSGIAFVIVQHLSLDKKSMMAELLKKYTSMKIVEITNNIRIAPNTIYLAPADKETAISNGKLCLMDPVIIRHGLRLPIDYFFRSLALEMEEHSIAVILSGTGSDGTLGLQAVKDAGGMVIVQDINSAKYDGMPRSAIATNLIDYILPVEKIADQLIKYVSHLYFNRKKNIEPDNLEKTDYLENIFILLKNKNSCDFSGYKKNTTLRRIERRMAINEIDDISIYFNYLQKNKNEADLLFKELLIGVTSFFRDKEVFDLLKQKIFPKIFNNRPKSDAVRIWVPACSTGEEVYSIAMILEEYMEKTNQRYKVQIFATDLNNESVKKARTGEYPSGIAADVSPEQLKRFFISENNNYKIKKEIREKIVFSCHNILSDPPFSKLDLLSCRNMLIYLDSNVQKKLIPIMFYALKPEGFLMLGSAENIGQFNDVFSAADKKWKIFSRKGTKNPVKQNYDFSNAPSIIKNLIVKERKDSLNKTGFKEIINKTILGTYNFPSVIIDENLNVIYFYGKTGKYLEPADGEAKLNILDMAREGLRSYLASAIRTASKENREIVCGNVKVRENGGFNNIKFIVKPLLDEEKNNGSFIIIFEQLKYAAEPKLSKAKHSVKEKKDDHTNFLEEELKKTKDFLQETIEELETTNEELKSTNEELQSSNEELQSSNEELETSKEEQQSVNEELTTVNTELNSKIEELIQSNNDMNNLLSSIDIATIFLDTDFCIKRFTPQAGKIINIIKEDVGRPINHFVSNLKYDGLQADLENVLNTLVYKELEVQTKVNVWYQMKIMPYRTVQNYIDGLVLTFVDITSTKEIVRLASIVRDSYDAVMVLDLDGSIIEWNSGAEKMYGLSENKAIGMNISAFIPEEEKSEMFNKIEQIINNKTVERFESKRIKFDNKTFDVMITLMPIKNKNDQITNIAATEHDLTKQKKTEEELRVEIEALKKRLKEPGNPDLDA